MIQTLSPLMAALIMQVNMQIFLQQTVDISDFKGLDNTQWIGQLMYVNYSDGQKVYLDKSLKIHIEDDWLIMKTEFKNEPNANNNLRIQLIKSATYFGNERINSFTRAKDGSFKMITQFETKDNGKQAIQIKTYMFDDQNLRITGKIDYQDGTPIFIRNQSTFKKIRP